jgi:hypothetical protein
MEEERLARLGKGKRKRDPSPELALNPMEGQPFCWQLGESAEEFVKRVSPLTTSVAECEWIWAANPYRDPRDKATAPRVAAFKDRGAKLLAESLQKRDEIQQKGRFGARSVITRAWNQEARALQLNLTKLAVETGVWEGEFVPIRYELAAANRPTQWMLFPKVQEVTRTWRTVVEATTNDRLGPMAKVAPEDGKEERLSRFIDLFCI